MKIDGIDLTEGSNITNITVPDGDTFPTNPNIGELFYKTSGTIGLYVYDGSQWVVSGGGGGSSSLTATQIGFGSSPGNILTGSSELTWSASRTLQVGLTGASTITPGDAVGTGNNLTVQAGTGTTQGGITYIKGGAASAGQAGRVEIIGGTPTAGNNHGAPVNITGGNAAGTGNAGSVVLTGGTPNNSQGGGVFLYGADGVGTNRSGGNIQCKGGQGSGTAYGGQAAIQGGDGGPAGGLPGPVTIYGGKNYGTFAAPGISIYGNIDAYAPIVAGVAGNSVTISGGKGNVSGDGGPVSMSGGSGGGSGTGIGGTVSLTGGTASGNGGNVIITGGLPGTGTQPTTAGYIKFSTDTGTTATERFRILANGAWSIGSTGTAYGTSGQVLTSAGDAPPTWSAVPTPTLTATQVGFGNGSNALTGDADLTWNSGTNSLTMGVGPGGTCSILGGNGVTLSMIAGTSTGSAMGGNVTITAGAGASGYYNGIITISAGRNNHATNILTESVAIWGNTDATTPTGTGVTGNPVVINGGKGNASGGLGGSVTVRGGAGGSTTGGGGNVNLRGGSTTSGVGGLVDIRGGPSTSSAGGQVVILGGTSTVGAGGMVSIAGADGASSDGNGGQVNLTGGAGGGAGSGGALALLGGTSSTGVGGNVSLSGGYGGTNNAGGNTDVIGGPGNGTGNGGNISILSGYSNTGAAGYIRFLTNGVSGTERFRILSTGAWSIGSTGTAYGNSGDVLTSSGNGAPSWQAVSASALPTNYIGYGSSTGTLTGSLTFSFNPLTGGLTFNPGPTANGANLRLVAPGNSTTGGGASAKLEGGVGTTGDGGDVLLLGGSTTSGMGGNCTVVGGDTNGINKPGGTSTIQGGKSYNTGEGGAVQLIGGEAAVGAGGPINIAGGVTANGNGGNVTIFGRAGVGTNKDGGYVDISGGNGTGTGFAGRIALVAGAGSTNGGYISLTTGGTQRLRVLPNGAWSVGSNSISYGASGQFLKSNGDAAPTWASVAITEADIPDSNLFARVGSNETITGTWTFNDNLPTSTLTPAQNNQLTTKAYVDGVAAGLDFKQSVKAATLPSSGNLAATYANGTAGFEATLTNSGTQAALTIDGITLVNGDRVLVKNQTNATQNGIYTVTNVGSGSTNWVLTRAADADNTPSNEVSGGMFTFVDQGTQAESGWVLGAPHGDAVLGTDNLTFTQYSQAGTITGSNVGDGAGQVFKEKSATDLRFKTVKAGTGITITNNTDDVTITAEMPALTNTNVAYGDTSGKLKGSSIFTFRELPGDTALTAVNTHTSGTAKFNLMSNDCSIVMTADQTSGDVNIALQTIASADQAKIIASTIGSSLIIATSPGNTTTEHAGNIQLSPGNGNTITNGGSIEFLPGSKAGGSGVNGTINLKSVDASFAPSVRFYDANSSNYTGLKAADTTTANVTYSLPVADGTGGQILSTNGSGLLSWTSSVNTHTHVLADITDEGTMAAQNANGVAITGGAINGTTIGATTAAAGTFTTLMSNNIQQWKVTRTLPVTVDDCVAIGQFSVFTASNSLEISITVNATGFSIVKTYDLATYFNQTANAWQIVNPIVDTGVYATNNIVMEARVNIQLLDLRIRRSGGSVVADAVISIENKGSGAMTFTESTTVTAAAPAITTHLSTAKLTHTSNALQFKGPYVDVGTSGTNMSGLFRCLRNSDGAMMSYFGAASPSETQNTAIGATGGGSYLTFISAAVEGMRLTTNQNLLVGTTTESTGTRVSINRTESTATTGMFMGLNSICVTTPPANSTTAALGAQLTGTTAVGTGITIAGSVQGVSTVASNTGTGTVTNAYGVNAIIQNTSTGAISSGVAFLGNNPVNTSGTLNNYYGFHQLDITAVQGNGTFAGVRSSIATNGNSRYNLYIDGTAKNFLGGQVLMGVNGVFQPRVVGASATAMLQIEANTNISGGSMSLMQNRNDIYGSRITFGKSRGAALGDNTIVQAGDELGTIFFAAADGTDVDSVGAGITAFVSGTPAANSISAELRFATANAGISPITRMTIGSAGQIGMSKVPDTNYTLSINGHFQAINGGISVGSTPSVANVGVVVISRAAGPAVLLELSGTGLGQLRGLSATQIALTDATGSNPILTATTDNRNVLIGTTTDDGTNKLQVVGNATISGTLTVPTIILNDALTTTSTTTTTAVTAGQVLYSVSATAYRSAEFTIQATQGTNYSISKVLVIHNGTTVSMTEFGNVIVGTNPATLYDADISGGNIRLLVTPASASSTTFKVVATAIEI